MRCPAKNRRFGIFCARVKVLLKYLTPADVELGEAASTDDHS